MRGEICAANFKPLVNGASLGSNFCVKNESTLTYRCLLALLCASRSQEHLIPTPVWTGIQGLAFIYSPTQF